MIYLLLLLVALLGTWLRLENISPFKFYPDAYQSLVVAENITKYHSVLGTLGPNGVIYPYFFMWSRSGYPLFIDLANIFFDNLEKSAYFVSFTASVLAIPACFWFIKKTFKSDLTGLLGALLIALSFNHVVWSGFIYTEAVGVLFLFLLLGSAFRTLEIKGEWWDWGDLLTGLFLTLAVFTRYEYLILVIPLSVLIFFKNPAPLIKIANIFISLAFFSSLILFQLYPINDLVSVVFLQLSKFLLILGAVILGGVGIILARSAVEYKIESLTPVFSKVLIAAAFGLSAFIIYQLLFLESALFVIELSGIRNFLINDPLIWFLSLSGLYLILKDNRFRAYGFFAILGILLLYPIYYQINPSMQRYLTHLLPFLLILAGYGMTKLLSFLLHPRGATLALLFTGVIVLGLQFYLTFNGIKAWDNGRWFRVSYEEKSAQVLQNRVNDHEYLIIASMPEAYYFYSHLSTQSILETDQPPFLDIPDSLNDQSVLIIQDMGMKDLFPNFSKFLDQNLSDKIAAEYWVGEEYNFGIRKRVEEKPVRVYQLSLKELKERILKIPFSGIEDS
jgi:hypothetical protein